MSAALLWFIWIMIRSGLLVRLLKFSNLSNKSWISMNIHKRRHWRFTGIDFEFKFYPDVTSYFKFMKKYILGNAIWKNMSVTLWMNKLVFSLMRLSCIVWYSRERTELVQVDHVKVAAIIRKAANIRLSWKVWLGTST